MYHLEAPKPTITVQNSQAEERSRTLHCLHRLYTGLLILSLLCTGTTTIADAQSAEPNVLRQTAAIPEGHTYSLFFPIIGTAELLKAIDPNPDITKNSYCQPQYHEQEGYALNVQETQLETHLRNDPGQEHPQLILSVALSQAARQRAQDMASHGYFGHVNHDGFGPNCIVLQNGFRLPDNYGRAWPDNNVESIAAGSTDMNAIWAALMASEKHAAHLLGKGEFNKAQTHYGIGYVEVTGSPYQYYVVFLLAAENGQ